MKKLISTYYSDNETRSSLVYKTSNVGYEVTFLETFTNREFTALYNELQVAEEHAEEWVKI